MTAVCVIVGLLLALGAIGAALNPSRCTVCGNQLKRKYHTWKIDGRTHRLCPHCNSSMERHQSKAAMRHLRGLPPVAGPALPFSPNSANRYNSGGRNALIALIIIVGAGVFLMRRGGQEERAAVSNAVPLRRDTVAMPQVTGTAALGVLRPDADQPVERQAGPARVQAAVPLDEASAAIRQSPARAPRSGSGNTAAAPRGSGKRKAASAATSEPLSPEERHAIEEAKRTVALIAARDACVSRLRTTPGYRAVASELSTYEARIKALRSWDPNRQLAAVSQRRLDAQGRLAKLEREAIAADEAVRAAEQALRTMQPPPAR
jgi:hypothetical protein